MAIFITLISIIAITGAVRILNKILPFMVCSICAGVAATWIWMFFGLWTGTLPPAVYQPITAMLMGGSVVGIAYALEKKLPENASALLWKTFSISVGFLLAHSLIASEWTYFWVSMALLVIISPIFFKNRGGAKKSNPKTKELENKMKHCC